MKDETTLVVVAGDDVARKDVKAMFEQQLADAVNAAIVEQQIADVDWLTVTTTDDEMSHRMYNEAVRTATYYKDLGFVQKPWSFKGYTGWMVGSLRFGVRQDGAISMLSGDVARMNFDVFLRHCTNVTRIDLAVTLTLADPFPDLAFKSYQAIGGPMFGECACKRKLTYLTNSNGGQTLYVGSRASDQYGRIYDKGAELREVDDLDIDLGVMWRYEVEFKKYRAKRLAGQILDNVSTTDDVHNLMGATVDKWFLSRGLPTIIRSYEEQPFLTDVSVGISDVETTLRWMSTQVSPSVQRLIAQGEKSRVLTALGISNIDTAEEL